MAVCLTLSVGQSLIKTDAEPHQLIKDITFVGSNNHAICIGEGSHVVLENCR